MLSKLVVGPALLATASAGAFTPERDIVLKRAACNRDNCLRAVSLSSPSSAILTRSQDCASFLRKTLTPCQVTSTITASSTVTAPTVIVLSTVTAESDSSTTVVVYFDAKTPTVTITPTVTFTVTNRNGIPTSIFNGAPTPDKKRDPAEETDLFPRAAAVTTCPSLASPSIVPSYASLCSGTIRYSSACSCLGLAQSTTTLVPQTILSTTTVITTITPTQTSSTTLFSTVVSEVTVSQTLTPPPTTITGPPFTSTTTTNYVCPTFTAHFARGISESAVVYDSNSDTTFGSQEFDTSNTKPLGKYIIYANSTVALVNDESRVWQADPIVELPGGGTLGDLVAYIPNFISSAILCTILTDPFNYLYCTRKGSNDQGFFYCDANPGHLFLADQTGVSGCMPALIRVGPAC